MSHEGAKTRRKHQNLNKKPGNSRISHLRVFVPSWQIFILLEAVRPLTSSAPGPRIRLRSSMSPDFKSTHHRRGAEAAAAHVIPTVNDPIAAASSLHLV